MSNDTAESFENTYPRYPFAPLVRMAIALGRLIALATRSDGRRTAAPSVRPIGQPRTA